MLRIGEVGGVFFAPWFPTFSDFFPLWLHVICLRMQCLSSCLPNLYYRSRTVNLTQKPSESYAKNWSLLILVNLSNIKFFIGVFFIGGLWNVAIPIEFWDEVLCNTIMFQIFLFWQGESRCLGFLKSVIVPSLCYCSYIVNKNFKNNHIVRH